MKVISVSDEYFEEVVSDDREFMLKHGRPCALVVRLRFRGCRRDFAVPLRSNIAPNAPKWQYFPLPPRPTTKPRHRHGLHYVKMFPIEKRYQRRFRTKGNPYYEKMQAILDENTSRIVVECQAYLDSYEVNGKPKYAVDLDKLIEALDKRK